MPKGVYSVPPDRATAWALDEEAPQVRNADLVDPPSSRFGAFQCSRRLVCFYSKDSMQAAAAAQPPAEQDGEALDAQGAANELSKRRSPRLASVGVTGKRRRRDDGAGVDSKRVGDVE